MELNKDQHVASGSISCSIEKGEKT